MNQDTTGVHWALVLLTLTGPRQSRLLAPVVKVALGLQCPGMQPEVFQPHQHFRLQCQDVEKGRYTVRGGRSASWTKEKALG